jgi:predicted DNA-binding transcriptional regulator AlpA
MKGRMNMDTVNNDILRFTANTLTEEQQTQPQVYSAMQIAKTLQISKSKVYAFLNDVFEGGNTMFKVIKIGTSIRVEKSSFDEWLHAATK